MAGQALTFPLWPAFAIDTIDVGAGAEVKVEAATSMTGDFQTREVCSEA